MVCSVAVLACSALAVFGTLSWCQLVVLVLVWCRFVCRRFCWSSLLLVESSQFCLYSCMGSNPTAATICRVGQFTSNTHNTGFGSSRYSMIFPNNLHPMSNGQQQRQLQHGTTSSDRVVLARKNARYTTMDKHLVCCAVDASSRKICPCECGHDCAHATIYGKHFLPVARLS